MAELKKISEIRELFNNAKEDELEGLLKLYGGDSRSGVQKLVEGLKKRLLKWDAELKRTEEMYAYERSLEGFSMACGIDEVGRGPLAGPVFAAAVILPLDFEIPYLNDSKKLSPAKREELSEIIRQEAVAFGIGRAEEGRIDEINIRNATFEAMRGAIQELSVKPDILLNDAVTIPDMGPLPQRAIIKGDAKVACIAAASIVAKVERDALMVEYDKIYPEYGFASNKGYGSTQHIEALKKYGPCPIHRRSFIGNFV